MKKKNKSQKQQYKLESIGRLILRFMNKKNSKIYNYKQIADGIDYKNPRQRELVIQTLHKLRAQDKIKEVEKGKYMVKQIFVFSENSQKIFRVKKDPEIHQSLICIILQRQLPHHRW